MLGGQDLLSGLASVTGMVNNAIMAGGGLYQNYKNYQQQQDLIDWQKQVYGENREWEKDTYATSLSREDSAVQRRIADLKAAGLSPTLAAGSAASTVGPQNLAPPPSMQAPQHDYMSNLQKLQQPMQIASGLLGLVTQQKQIASLDADVQGKLIDNEYKEKLNPQKVYQLEMLNNLTKESMQYKIDSAKAESINKKWQSQGAELDAEYKFVRNLIQKEFGITGARLDLMAKDVTLNAQKLNLWKDQYNYSLSVAAGMPTNQSWSEVQKLGIGFSKMLNNILDSMKGKMQEYMDAINNISNTNIRSHPEVKYKDNSNNSYEYTY